MTKAFSRKSGEIYVIHGVDVIGMTKRLLEAAGVAKAIPAGASIALKPNLVVARPADGGATTHPGILAGVIEHLRDHGHGRIDIIEGSWVGDDTRRAFARCGIDAVAKRYGAATHDLKEDSSTPVDTPAGKIRVCDKAREAGFLINLPVLKGHCQTRVTCALKNMKGCIPDDEKRRFHREGLDTFIAALATAIVPDLTLVDGICGDLDFEEGGNPVRADRLLLGADSVKLDAYACALLGINPAEIPYIVLAERHGVGTMAVGEGDIVELNKPTAAPSARASGQAAVLGRRVKADQACSACYANCIHALKRLEERGAARRLPPISIGQGWKGKRMDGVGIGACCSGAARPVAGCPPSALDIVKELEHGEI